MHRAEGAVLACCVLKGLGGGGVWDLGLMGTLGISAKTSLFINPEA